MCSVFSFGNPSRLASGVEDGQSQRGASPLRFQRRSRCEGERLFGEPARGRWRWSTAKLRHLDTLGLESSIASSRTLAYLAQTALKSLEVGRALADEDAEPEYGGGRGPGRSDGHPPA